MTLKIDNLKKIYQGNIVALEKFNLNLDKGILGFLGPNGAGKSTLMKILATITEPTAGKVFWKGKNIIKHPNVIRKVLGYLPQDFGVYPNLNAVEFLEYIASIKGLEKKGTKKRINQLLQIMNLYEERKRALKSYSGGMKQRIGIAQALLNDPEILIVDEPTVGLDPAERISFLNLLSNLAKDRIIILSTHIVTDIESIATEIALIKEGQLLMHVKPEKLLQKVENKVWEWTIPSNNLTEIKEEYTISGTKLETDGLRVRIINETSPGQRAHCVSPTLEDAYLYSMSGNNKGDY